MNFAVAAQYWRMTWISQQAFGEDLGVIEHEMGHAFGLPHSFAVTFQYPMGNDNIWDVMGIDAPMYGVARDPIYGDVGQHTIAYHKDFLGWISITQKYEVTLGTQETNCDPPRHG